jgi:hypothetical protein
MENAEWIRRLARDHSLRAARSVAGIAVGRMGGAAVHS